MTKAKNVHKYREKLSHITGIVILLTFMIFNNIQNSESIYRSGTIKNINYYIKIILSVAIIEMFTSSFVSLKE